VVSGHAGGSQKDLRRVAEAFTKATGIPVVVKTDPEWGGYEGDHAGAYEISQLQAIHPEAVDLSLLERMNEEGSGGRLALGLDAAEASPEKGREINETIISAIGAVAEELKGGAAVQEPITYQQAEEIWAKVLSQGEWWSNGEG
jgi:creatinine amidohydrolase